MGLDKSIQDELPKLKKLVEKSNAFFKDNYNRFNEFRKLVYECSISESEKNVNEAIDRPNIETNVLTAYNSRMCGEFAKQEPDIEVSRDEGSQVDPRIIPIVEGHFRHILEDAKRSNMQYHTYRDTLSGGYSSADIFTDYAHSMSLKQVIKVRKSKYPTLAGYDPLATEPHKGDGNYSFQIYPKIKEDFQEEYPEVDIEEIKFKEGDSLAGFSWAFNNTQEDIILLCKMFKKKKRKETIMELSDGQTLTKKQYEKFIEEWNTSGKSEPAPIIAGKPRDTLIDVICMYIFIENKIIEYKETDFKYLPQVYFDGDSIDLYDNLKGCIKQHTRPYLYNAKGAQQLKNLAVQCLANHLEGLCQHKFIVMKEAIPEEKEYLNALTSLQIQNTMVVNAFKDNNPDHPIQNPIIPIPAQPAPPEIITAIEIADKIIQNELGSYDAQLGINQNQLSGVAIIEGATQSNSAAMPHVVNYLCSLTQIANICVDLMPKYYKTPMTIPIIDKEGNRKAIRINDKEDPNSIDFNYDSNMLQVKVSAGLNWAVQKARALNQIIAMTQASPGFADFMNKKGLKVLLDNFEIRGIDILKQLADEYQQEQQKAQQQQQQMAQQAMQNNPNMMNAHSKAFSAQADAALRTKELQLEEKKQQMELVRSQAELEATLAKAHAEEVRAQADMHRENIKSHVAILDMHHKHGKDVVDMAHKVHGNMENSEVKNEETEIG